MLKFARFLAEDPFEIHKQLNPLLWDRNNRLLPEVKEKLLQFAEAWGAFAKIPPAMVNDIILTGGNAGFLYNGQSDLDVHLLVDRAALGYGPLVDDFLQDRKTLWSVKHHITVKGIPVEPYAQDLSERPPAGQGIYSLRNDVWIQFPSAITYDPAADPVLAKKVAHWMGVIDKVIKERRPLSEFQGIRKKLSDMRKRGLARRGELDRDNLIFKALRNSGHIDRMNNYVAQETDRELSG